MPERGTGRCSASPARVVPGAAASLCGAVHGSHPTATTRGGHGSCLAPLPHTSDRGDGEERSDDGSIDLSAVPWAGGKDNPH